MLILGESEASPHLNHSVTASFVGRTESFPDGSVVPVYFSMHSHRSISLYEMPWSENSTFMYGSATAQKLGRADTRSGRTPRAQSETWCVRMWRGRCQTAAVFIPPPAALRGHSFALGRFPARVGHGSMSTASSRVALAPPLAECGSRASRRSTPAVVSAAVRGPRDCGKKRTTRHDDDVVTSSLPRLGAPPAPWSCAAVGLWASAVPPSRAAESLAAMSALTGGDAAALVDRARDALDALETLPQIETVPLWWAVLTISEMVPLLPTQPMALTSGIAFGAAKGTAVVFAANVAAATLAFLAAKGFGRAVAERVVEEVTGGGGDEAGSSGAAAEDDDDEKKKTRSARSGARSSFAWPRRARWSRPVSSRCSGSPRTRSARATTSSA